MKRITQQLRGILSQPMGEIKQNVPDGRKVWACVGDYSCKKILEQGIEVKVIVYDLKTKRVGINDDEKNFFLDLERPLIECVNPPGTITSSLEDAIDQAVKSKTPVKLFVDGEEDLAVLPLIEKAPFNSLIVYGQPDQGMVVVECSTVMKQKAIELLKKFEEDE